MQRTDRRLYASLPGLLSPLGLFVFLVLNAGSESDPELVRRIKQADNRAFRDLFDRYHLNLYRFLLRMGAPEETAEDILQDVFAGLWTARGGLDPSRSVRAYLYRACRNRAANYFRSRPGLTQALADEPVSSLPSQDDQLSFDILKAELSRAVSALPERRRAVFELCFMSGLSYKEAADILEISTKTVENQMAYAFKAIRERLGPFIDKE